MARTPKADPSEEGAEQTVDLESVPAPVEFHALDRFHAATHVAQALPDVAGPLKERLAKALHGTAHRGPVHVAIPAPPAMAGAPAVDPEAPEDPLLPKDGAFAVKPFHFVRV